MILRPAMARKFASNSMREEIKLADYFTGRAIRIVVPRPERDKIQIFP